MTDMDERLADYGRRWRAAQHEPNSLDLSRCHSGLVTSALVSRPTRTAIGLVGAVAAAGLVIGAVAVLGGQTSESVVVGAPNLPVPIAAPPLLRYLPRPTPPILLASSGTPGASWSLYAKVSPLSAKGSDVPVNGKEMVSFGPGLCLSVSVHQTSGVACSDPRQTASLLSQTYGPMPEFDTELVYGVTSSEAKTVIISFGHNQPQVTTRTFTTGQLPALRFFVAQAPASAQGARVEVEAIAANGTPLIRTDPQLPPPPPLSPPISVRPDTPGTYPVWPLNSTDTADRSTALAVARDFSTTALGATGNSVTADPSAPAHGPTFVTIVLPDAHSSLRVLAIPTTDGTWTLVQVGDQTGGISFASGRPTVTFNPPAGATQADITERTDAGVHQLRLTQANLRTRSAVLTGRSIYDVLIVYRSPTGVAIGAAGGQF